MSDFICTICGLHAIVVWDEGVRKEVHLVEPLGHPPQRDGPTSIDAAWALCESRLREDWILEVGNWQAEPNRPAGLAKYEAIAEPYSFAERERQGSCIGRGDTPAAALNQLAFALQFKEIQHESSRDAG